MEQDTVHQGQGVTLFKIIGSRHVQPSQQLLSSFIKGQVPDNEIVVFITKNALHFLLFWIWLNTVGTTLLCQTLNMNLTSAILLLVRFLIMFKLFCVFLTGPPTQCRGQTSNGRWCLQASVFVCNAEHMQRNSPGGSMQRASRVTSR